MQVRVVLMRRKGVPLERNSLAREPVHAGDLRVEERQDESLHRVVRFARLAVSMPMDRESLPPLQDVQLLWMGPGGMVLTGFERLSGADYAQGWWCRQP